MCMSFELISGKKSKGDKSMLKGITKMYTDAGYKVAIVSVPTEDGLQVSVLIRKNILNYR